MDNQLYDVKAVETECPINVDEDSKDVLICQVVGKMIVL